MIGGFVGDLAAARYPNHGRILITQFSVFAGVPLSLILMKVCAPLLQDPIADPELCSSCRHFRSQVHLCQGKGTTPTMIHFFKL